MADEMHASDPKSEVQEFRRDADRGREPHLIAARAGTRMYSLAALQERCETQFSDEHGDDSAALRTAATQTERVKLILETVNYVLALESVNIAAELKAQLIANIHANLFGYGVLDALLSDPEITTIAVHGADHVSVRYGHEDLISTGLLFEDENQLRRILNRMLKDAGAELNPSEPIVETGLIAAGRRASLSVATPPASPFIHLDMRLHPLESPTLQDLETQGWFVGETANLLRQIAASKYGFVIVGESESGKTTLLNALLPLLSADRLLLVERTGELQVPSGAVRLMPRWSATDDETITFGQQVDRALAMKPATLVLDEIRTDEPLMILPLLTTEDPPRQIWSVRGVSDAKRLQSSLGMLARRADMVHSEEMVNALYDRLPFVITVRNIKNQLQVFSVAEWQSRVDSDYPDYVMLMQYQDGAARPTGAALARWLEM